MANRFSEREVTALRKQCEGIMDLSSAAGRYIDTGMLLDGVVDSIESEILFARDVISDPNATDEDRRKWTAAIPLLEKLLAAARQEIADGKPVEPVAPNEFENAWKWQKPG